MKLHTTEELSDLLSQELAWRRKELHHLKELVTKHRNSFQGTLLLRGAVPVLYAHWEGFVKKAGTAYLNYVATQKLTYKSLASHFLALAMKKLLNEAGQANKVAVHIKVARFFLSELDQPCTLPWKSAVVTKANLNFDLFRQILGMLGLTEALYLTKEKIVDEKLLRTRNEIAHGEQAGVDYEEYIEVHDEILALMILFKDDIENAAITASYKIVA